jgi:hypothetical protein
MSAAANIVLADGQTTPVNVTFYPESVSPERSSFVDRSPGISAAFRRLIVKFSPASKTRATSRPSYEVEYPVTAVVDGVTTVVRTLRANVQLVEPDGCTDAERKDLYAFLYNGLNNALIKGAMRDYDPIF